MTDPMQAATEFAVRSHAGQVRRGGRLPYVSHCFEVLKVAWLCSAPVFSTNVGGVGIG